MKELTTHLPWRTGRSVGRTIYVQLGNEPDDSDILIGTMDTPELAGHVVDLQNNWLAKKQRYG